jgi:hypothetical protein
LSARPFGMAVPNRSSEGLALASDFNGFGMDSHVLRAAWRSESVRLTMPRIGLKSDGGAFRLSPESQTRRH